ncbi:hypothetical protein HUG10_19375 (plasmid) [Halorarum halophilum]|uniref:Uncharacterized protein n=1 Tax=Halorarum halophilum TaxID=2743090 RepID=A0A7D5GEF3_9EURY|nr:hypothetical protein [Halobaculum halophilum]QLG29766.1 hypothetical protein HUG10_19375 [Halobaculum halophilum]
MVDATTDAERYDRSLVRATGGRGVALSHGRWEFDGTTESLGMRTVVEYEDSPNSPVFPPNSSTEAGRLIAPCSRKPTAARTSARSSAGESTGSTDRRGDPRPGASPCGSHLVSRTSGTRRS